MSELDQILKGIQDPVEFMCQVIVSYSFFALFFGKQRLEVEMGPDPARAYFWPAVNKSTFDPTRTDFIWPERKKIEKGKFSKPKP